VAGIKINIDSSGASTGAAQVTRALDQVADQAVKSVSAIDRVQAALRSAGGGFGAFSSQITGIAASTKRAESSFTTLGGAITRITAGFAALGVAAATRALVRVTTDAIDAASALVDTADRIGVGVEALQELRFAATQSGLTVEQFDKGLQVFTTRLGEAASGTGKAKDALKAFGLDAKELSKDPAKALTTIADKIAGLSTQAEKLDRAKDIFGPLGAVFVNLLQQGGPALDAMRQKARDFGIVLDEELARKSEALGDEFALLSQVIGTQFKTALLEIAPILIKVAGAAATLTQGIVDLSQKAGLLGTPLRKDITETAEAIFKTQQEITRLKEKNAGAGNDNPVAAAFGTLDRDIQFQTDKLGGLQTKLQGLQTEFKKTAPAIQQTAAATAGLTDEQIKAGEAIEKQIKRTKEQAETLNLSGVALADQIAKQALLDGATEDQAKRLRQEVIALENAKAAREANTKAIQDQAEAEREAIRKQAEAKREAEALAKAIDADRMKREEFLADLLSKRAVQEQEDAQANIASLAALQGELASLQEEGRLINASLGPKQELVDLEREIAITRINREAATARATATENGLTEAETANIEAARLQKIANVEATASFAAMATSIEDAALSTADLKTVTDGLFDGNLAESVLDLGKTVGDRFIDGILFGKGQSEQAILGNFNQLLGVDAAGLFGAQGANLGGGLIDGILGSVVSGGKSLLSKAGIDLGGLFGTSFSSTAGGVISGGSSTAGGGLFGNVVAGGSTTATTSGGLLGNLFGSAIAGAAGLALGKGLGGLFGVGGSKTGKIGGNIGGLLGGIGGSFLGPIGSFLGSGLGSLLGGFVGDLFKSKPSKGTEIRKGVKDFLKDIEVSFASEIDSGDYFFEETKKLAKKMFGGDDGGDFLKASKAILNDKIGPELAKQLQALGAFVTAQQARKLNKDVEQTSTTFGNLLLDNLGLDPEAIDDAVQEIIEKGKIGFSDIIDKLNNLSDKGKIGTEFFQDAVMGAVDIFNRDLPDAIDASAIALKSFGEDGLFDIEKFQTELAKVTGSFELIVNSFLEVIQNKKPGEDVGKLLGEQIQSGLRDLAVDAFLTDFINTKLFADIDLTDGLGADELLLLQQRAVEAGTAVDALRDGFGDVGDEIGNAAEDVEDLFQQIRSLTERRFELRLEVIGDLETIGAITGLQGAQARVAAFTPQVNRFANPAGGVGAGPLGQRNDLELAQGVSALQGARQAQVDLFRGYEEASATALQNRIGDINADFAARRGALEAESAAAQRTADLAQQAAESAQRASQDRIDSLSQERDSVQELFQLRLDGLQEELQLAEQFRQLAQSIQQTITGLVTSTSRFTGPEQLASAQRRAAELRGQIAGAPKEQQGQLIQELTSTLASQLSIGQQFLDPTRFAAQFEGVVKELETLRANATIEGDRVEIIQAEIAATTAQMEVQLRSIDAQIEIARADGQRAQEAAQAAQQAAQVAQQLFQEQAAELSRQEQVAILQAEAESAAALDLLRIEVAEEIRRLAVIEDQLLAEQIERAVAQANLTIEQLTVLHSIDAGVSALTGSIIGLFDSVISAKVGFDGVTTKPQLFLAHGNEHVKITPVGQQSNGNSNVTLNLTVPVTVNGQVDGNAIGKIITQAVADDIRHNGKIRTAIKEVK
jgi:hypothetical protein